MEDDSVFASDDVEAISLELMHAQTQLREAAAAREQQAALFQAEIENIARGFEALQAANQVFPRRMPVVI
jgi:hypothetical protein